MWVALSLHGQVPERINYQGRLVDGSGLVNGTTTIVFRLYNVDTGGTPLYEETQTVTIVDGLYASAIGLSNVVPGALSSVLTNDAVYLELAVGTTTLAPRERLSAVPYSLMTESVRVGGISSAMLADGAVSAEKLGTGSVTSTALASNAVQTVHIADAAVTVAKILQDAVGGVATTGTNVHPAATSNAFFGRGIALVGPSNFVVGAPGDDSGIGYGTGRAFLYDEGGTLLATITNPSPAAGDEFGRTLAAVGSDRFVVGAPFDGTAGGNAGSVYLYDLTGTLLATVTNPAPAPAAPGDFFGMSLFGVGTNRFAVGAPAHDEQGETLGSAYLFDRNGTLLATITNPTPLNRDSFGDAVAAAGPDRFVVGDSNDDRLLPNSGGVYLYDLAGNLLATVTNPAGTGADYFGATLASVGTNMFAAHAWDAGDTSAGIVYLYDNAGTLVRTIENPEPGAVEYFGAALGPVGVNRLLIGNAEDDIPSTNSGSAYLYTLDGVLEATIRNPSPDAGDLFGRAVAGRASGRLLIGADGDDTEGANAGRVYRFDLILCAGGLIAETVADDAITARQLADGAVGSAEIADGAVGADEIAADAVGADQIADGAVSSAQLAHKYEAGVLPLSSLESQELFQSYDTNFVVAFSAAFATNPVVTAGILSPHADVRDTADLYVLSSAPTQFTGHVFIKQHVYTVQTSATLHAMTVVDGCPAILFSSSLHGLGYVRAGDANGDAWGAPVTVAPKGYDGNLAVVNGKPACTFTTGSCAYANLVLHYAQAENAHGSAWRAPVVVESSGYAGLYNSLAVVDGRPAIAYKDEAGDDLEYVRANDADGTSWGASVTVSAWSNSGDYASLNIKYTRSGAPLDSFINWIAVEP